MADWTDTTITETVGGTADVLPVITLTCDEDLGATTITITNNATGEVFEWVGTITTSDVLVINCETWLITLNSVASMSGHDGDFITLKPGSNEIVISGFSGTLKMTYRDRYL